mmetsp:Transcript_24226/g.38915  ORF Transcript_24226/g.38915 Transcript_24226/m.38915 type:complete len:121 (+) Transcript_24226:630-992(+)
MHFNRQQILVPKNVKNACCVMHSSFRSFVDWEIVIDSRRDYQSPFVIILMFTFVIFGNSYKSEMFTSMSSVTVGVLGTLRSVISRSIFKSKKPPPSAEDGTRQSLRTTPGRDAVEKKGPT